MKRAAGRHARSVEGITVGSLSVIHGNAVDALCHVQAGGLLSLESLGEPKADVHFRWGCHRAIAYFARVCFPSITSFSGSSPVAISNL